MFKKIRKFKNEINQAEVKKLLTNSRRGDFSDEWR